MRTGILVIAAALALLSGCSSDPILVSAPVPVQEIPLSASYEGEAPREEPRLKLYAAMASKPVEVSGEVEAVAASPPKQSQDKSQKASIKPAVTVNTPTEYPATSVPTGKFWNANAAYQIPPTMIVNVSSPVDLWIDASKSSEQLASELREYLEENARKASKRMGADISVKLQKMKMGTTEITTQAISIAKDMYAELSGSEKDFAIDPKGPRKITARNGTLTWHWTVTPLKISDTGLPLTLTVTADPGDGGTPLKPIQETVVVKTDLTWWQQILEFLKNNDLVVKLITGGAGLAVLGGLLRWICNRAGVKRSFCKKLTFTQSSK